MAACDHLTRRIWGPTLFDMIHDEPLQVTSERSLLVELSLYVLHVELYLAHGQEQLTQCGGRSIIGIRWKEIHWSSLKTPWYFIKIFSRVYFIFLPQAIIKSDSHASPKWIENCYRNNFVYFSFVLWNLVG